MRGAFARSRGWDMAVAGMLAVLAAGWTAFVLAAAADRLPRHVPAAAQLAVAVAIAVALVTSRREIPASAGWVVGWMVLLPTAVLAAHVVTDSPTRALAAPALVGSALLARRLPAAGVLVALAVTGFYGTLSAYTSIPGGKVIDALLAGILAAVLWDLLFAGRTERFNLPPGVLCLLGLGAVGLAHVLLAPDVSFALRFLRSSTLYVLALVAVAVLARRQDVAQRIARGVLVIALAVAGYAVLRYITGPAHQEELLAARQPYNENNGALRLIGSLLSRHQLAVWLGAVLPFCAAVAVASGSRVRVATAALAGLSGVAIIATNSRGGFLAAITGVAAVVLLLNAAPAFPGFRLGTAALAGLGALTVGAIAMTLILTPSDRRHFENILHPGSDQAYQARQVKWRAARHSIARHPWGLGLGQGSGLSAANGAADHVGAHNIDNSYLTLAYEQGWAAIILFGGGLILLAGRLVLHVRRCRDPVSAGLAAGGCAALLSFAAAMYGGNYLVGTTALAAWLVVGVGVSRVIVAPQRAEEPAPVRTAAGRPVAIS
jgi:hypothetical protein